MSQRQRIIIAQAQRLALNTGLHASIRLLRSDAEGLARYLEDQAAENPHLRLTPAALPEVGEWLPRWSGVHFQATSGGSAREVETASAAPSLIAHVLAAVEKLSLTPCQRRTAQALTEALEPTGWLGTDLPDIASALKLTLAEVEAVVAKVQRIEPAGLFARNLEECLVLQAQDAGFLDREMRLMLANLPLLASGAIARLAEICGCDADGVRRRFAKIRSLNPKPGADFLGGTPAPIREPDLLARPRRGGGWTVSLNRSVLPDVEVSDEADDKSGVDRALLSSARALRHMVKARNTTLLQVGREIVRLQTAALKDGPGALQPMTMAGVGAALNLHESTISRVVAGVSLDSPRGTWWLRQMFSGRAGDKEGGATQASAAALRHRIGRLIAAESPSSPVSDQALCDRLVAETGISIARRTVAKYRAMAGIPPASRRRKRDWAG